MKRFSQSDLRAAYAHAATGGQALHVCQAGRFTGMSRYQCFRGARIFAHLIDNDAERLEATARRLGVNVIKIDRLGREGQHIDLCGKPLERALEIAEGRVLFANA